MAAEVREGDLLWQPDAERAGAARITRFAHWLRTERGVSVGPAYPDLHRWSVEDVDGFWSAFSEWAGVRWHDRPAGALTEPAMPGAVWFPGGTLNYAEHSLHPPVADDLAGGLTDATAVISVREDGRETHLTWRQLRSQVAAMQRVLADLGVGPGDRVVAVLPNAAEALVAMLATAALGAVWSSCSPDFGARGIADRFTQVDPVVLLAVDGYRYNGKPFDIRATVAGLAGQLPTLKRTILVPWLEDGARLDGWLRWPDLLADADPEGVPSYLPVPFNHPLWILYSSGTTGLPKPIVHGHGGITVEHLKQLALHLDLGPGDRFCWFSTTGWMMWNLLVSGLAAGSTIVLYDGSPTYPDQLALWRLAERTGLTCLGVSAPYLQAMMRAGVRPWDDCDLSRLRTLGSTGAPLPPEGFAWVYQQARDADVMLSSLSGGTDVCTAFLGGVPTLPVRAGEIPAALLGCAIAAYDGDGRPVIDTLGELVVTAPMPSMPVGFWNDPDGSRLRAAYFEDFPGVWRHGDWVRVTPRGSFVIYGRSDSTLNRGGVRMGTSEFYRVVDEVPEVEDSLVVDTSSLESTGKLILFVKLIDDADAEAVAAELKARIRAELSPRHVPDEVVPVPAVPRTLNGKKTEVPIKRILLGMPVEQAVAAGALADPAALRPFVEYAASHR